MTQIQPEGLDVNSQKEEFSYAYINAIATIAGYVCEVKRRGMDNAGIDLTVEVPGEIVSCLSPKFDAQVKCTSQECIYGDFIHFDLRVKNYERLIHPASYVSQILIIVLVPKDVDKWIKINRVDEILTLFSASAYWISLKGKEKTTNKEKITVKIPLINRFSPEVLKEIMRKIAQNEGL